MRARGFAQAGFSQSFLKHAGQLTRIFSHDAARICWPWTCRLHQHIGHAAQLFTLQVAANQAGFLTRLGLRPNGILQGVIHIRQTQGLFWIIHLHAHLSQARGHRRRIDMIENFFLHACDQACNRSLHAAVAHGSLKSIGSQTGNELRLELETVSPKEIFGDQSQGFFLFGCTHRFKHCVLTACTFAPNVHTANVFGCQWRHTVELIEATSEAAGQAFITFTCSQVHVLQTVPQLTGEFHTQLVIGQWVGSQVKAIDHGIHATHAAIACVFIRVVLQLRPAGLGQNLCKSLHFLTRCKLFVTKLNSPIVIGSQSRHDVLALLLTFGRNVVRRVVHDR